MPYLRGVVVLDLSQAAVLAGLLGRDARGRRERLSGTSARTRKVGLTAIAAVEDGARAWSEQLEEERNGHSDVRQEGSASSSTRDQECSIAEAEQLTGLCQRQLRRLAPQLGRKVGGRWRLSRDEVLAFAQDREARRPA